MYNYAQGCDISICPFCRALAAHLPRSLFQLVERVRTDGPIVSIPSWVMAITVNVYFPGLTIVITTAFRIEVLD